MILPCQDSRLHNKTLKRTRRFVVDGVEVSITTSKIISEDEKKDEEMRFLRQACGGPLTAVPGGGVLRREVCRFLWLEDCLQHEVRDQGHKRQLVLLLHSPVHPSIHLHVRLFTHLPAHPYTQLFTHSSTHHPPTHPPTHSPTHPSIHPLTRPSTHSFTHPSVHPPIRLLTHPLIHPPTHPSTHPPTHRSIYPCTCSSTRLGDTVVIQIVEAVTVAELTPHDMIHRVSPSCGTSCEGGNG